MEVLSRKATDKEIGLSRKRLEEVMGYWANQWNYKQLSELPDYVQDLYILFTYSLWLEEQVATLRGNQNGTILTDTQPDNSPHTRSLDGLTIPSPNDNRRVTQEARLPVTDLVDDKPKDDGGSGEDSSRPTNEVSPSTGGTT